MERAVAVGLRWLAGLCLGLARLQDPTSALQRRVLESSRHDPGRTGHVLHLQIHC